MYFIKYIYIKIYEIAGKNHRFKMDTYKHRSFKIYTKTYDYKIDEEHRTKKK